MSAEPERAETEVIRVTLHYDKNQYVAEIVCGETLEYMEDASLTTLWMRLTMGILKDIGKGIVK